MPKWMASSLYREEVDTELTCLIYQRFVEIARDAVEYPQSLNDRMRYGYLLMAAELENLGVINKEFLSELCRVIDPELGRYYFL